MLQKLQIKTLRLQRAIKKPAQSAIHLVGQPDRHHIDQIMVIDLLQEPLAQVSRQVVNQAIDHEEDRNEENYEKINDNATNRNAFCIWNGIWTDCL
jgi:hypothetical protein